MSTVHIDDLDQDGRGLGEHKGRRVVIAGALPGESVRVAIEHGSPHRPMSWARLLTVEATPSADRVDARCPGHGRCGGCSLQHLSYPGQLAFKRRRVQRAMAAHGQLADLVVDPIVASPAQWAYRSQVKYVLVPAKSGLACASFAPASHTPINMAGCLVPEDGLDALAQFANDPLYRSNVPVYDEHAQRGELRYFVARKSVAGKFLLALVTRTDQPRAALREVAQALMTARPDVVGVVHNVNATTSGSIFGDDDTVLCGTGALDERVGDVALHLSTRSFSQGNRAQAANIYRAIAQHGGAGKCIVDLYCGVGPIAFALAHSGARVVGVENNPAAIIDAQMAARSQGLEGRVSFVAADAADGLRQAHATLQRLDLVVVNPPRKGLSAQARAAVIEAAPAMVIYVSCQPESLAADLAAFHSSGYRSTALQPFDMLPGTPHVETLAVLVSSKPQP